MDKQVNNQKTIVKPMSKTLEKIIGKLKNSEIDCFSVPKRYENNRNIIDVERQLGMRKLGKRGYDIIRNVFFVEERLSNGSRTKQEINYFDDFKTYAAFIDNEIYDNACYYQCDISKIKLGVDFNKLNKCKFFVEDTIDDYTVLPTNEEILRYDKGEQIKKECKEWINKFNNCETIDKFREVEQNYRKSKLATEFRDFFLWQYIYSAINNKEQFNILMQYMSDYICDRVPVREICFLFNPDDVVEAWAFTDSSRQYVNKQKKRLKDVAAAVKNGFVNRKVNAFFDEVSHYYCEQCTYTWEWKSYSTYRYFETFEDFIKYRNGDLTHCDLSKDIKFEYDITKYKTDETTKLPFGNIDNLRYVVKKAYSKAKDKFKVLQEWYDSDGELVKRYNHEFDYFFDFVAFLKGDLSDADLLSCDGLQNLNDISGIDLKNASVRSSIFDKFGVQYELYKIDDGMIESFSYTEENEKCTELALQTCRKLDKLDEFGDSEFSRHGERVYYISDIHLMHKLKYFEPKTKADVGCAIKFLVDNIIRESKGTILIGGDLSSDFSIFELFIKIFRRELDNRGERRLVIVVLGNHELWGFSQNSFDEIVKKYDDLLDKYGMYLLQNNIIYRDDKRGIQKITTEELLSVEEPELRDKIVTSRITFFGGLAFSGYNEKFNANNGIYRDIIDRATEIKESKKFEELYKKVCSIFHDKNVVIFTHMPMDCWSENVNYHENYVYVSGHTHRNYFHDDGNIRVYACNQIGYKNNNPHMKWFDLENDYDYFADEPNGKYEITRDEYREFYMGKNIQMTFNREGILYMLKRNGYYCFILESKDGSLNILNAGALKKLDRDDIDYYYKNMDSVVAHIKKPLDAYTNIQEAISAEIQMIGGSGYIHGAIIDIDGYNHVYVNPIDMKITGYWASDIINKKVYPTVSELLKQECPMLYERYTDLLKESSENLHALRKNENNELAVLPQIYLDIDIYKVSREIKKMQKLSSNILTTWYETDDTNRMIEIKIDI